MVLRKAEANNWEKDKNKLARAIVAITTPPHTKTHCQIAEENGFGVDGEQMCRLLITSSAFTESQLQVYSKKVRALSGGEVK